MRLARVCAGLCLVSLLPGSGAPVLAPWEAGELGPGARLFAPGLISTGDDDAHVTFFADGRHVYFLKNTPDFSHWTIAVVEWTGTTWGQPRVAPFSGRWAEGDLSFAPDGRTAYFVSTRPLAAGAEARADTDIWRLHRTGDGWGRPEHVAELSSEGFEWYPNMTVDGWLYFGSERAEGNLGKAGTSDLWRARLEAGRFSTPENLGPVLNTAGQDIEPWISADGRLLLFASNGRPDTRGSYDIYVSRRCGEVWSTPRNLGPEVNSPGWDFGPRPSPDGRFLFFTSNRVAADRLPARALSFEELVARLRAPGNGLRDVYRIATEALDLGAPCERQRAPVAHHAWGGEDLQPRHRKDPEPTSTPEEPGAYGSTRVGEDRQPRRTLGRERAGQGRESPCPVVSRVPASSLARR